MLLQHQCVVKAAGVDMPETDDDTMKPVANLDTAITWKFVLQRQAERAEKVKQRAELDRDLVELDRWLEAAKVLFGGIHAESGGLPALEEDKDDDVSMASATVLILNGTDLWLDYDALRERLSENPRFSEGLKQSPNYFYTMLARLERRGEVERRGGLVRGLKKSNQPRLEQ